MLPITAPRPVPCRTKSSSGSAVTAAIRAMASSAVSGVSSQFTVVSVVGGRCAPPPPSPARPSRRRRRSCPARGWRPGPRGRPWALPARPPTPRCSLVLPLGLGCSSERLGGRVRVGAGELATRDCRRVAAHQPHADPVWVIIRQPGQRRHKPVAITAGQGADRALVTDEPHDSLRGARGVLRAPQELAQGAPAAPQQPVDRAPGVPGGLALAWGCWASRRSRDAAGVAFRCGAYVGPCVRCQ